MKPERDLKKESRYSDYLKERGYGILPPNQYLSDMTEAFKDIYKKIQPYTMISPERGWALYSGVQYIIKNNIQGDFAECGVWKGGSCMLMALTLLAEGITDRNLWMYDTYEGMTEPTPEDKIASSGEAVSTRFKEGWWAEPLEGVKNALASTGYPMDNIHFVKGDVLKTLETDIPDSCALIRLDTDWYASTKKELEVLYPKLEQKGLCFIDDYGHFTGSKQAVDEYLQEKELFPLLHRNDYTGRTFQK